MSKLHLTIEQIRCDNRIRDSCVEISIDTPIRITIREFSKAMWKTKLKRNMGLITGDMDCKGVSYPLHERQEKCLCYGTIGLQDRAWKKAQILEEQYMNIVRQDRQLYGAGDRYDAADAEFESEEQDLALDIARRHHNQALRAHLGWLTGELAWKTRCRDLRREAQAVVVQ
jgi:hypothetical protein